MSSRRATLIGLVLLLACDPVLLACDSGNAGPAPAGAPPAVPADPRQALAASTAGLAQGNYTFTEAAPRMTAQGAVHQPSGSAWLDVAHTDTDAAGTLHLRALPREFFYKFQMAFGDEASPSGNPGGDDAGPVEDVLSDKTWMRVDKTAPGAVDDFPRLDGGDVTGASAVLAGVVTAERAGDTIRGTLDASRRPDRAILLPQDEIEELKGKATALPYVATIDQQGRLLTLAVDVPAVGETPAGSRTVTITGYGNATAAPKPPANEIQEAPPQSP